MRTMQRIAIEEVTPAVAGGDHPAKAVVGQYVPVGATLWREGHAALAAQVVWRGPHDAASRTVRMAPGAAGTDRWLAAIVPDAPGLWTFRVDGWGDPWATWSHAVEANAAAGVHPADLDNDFEDGARLLTRAARRVGTGTARRALLLAAAARLRRADALAEDRLELARSPQVREAMDAEPVRELLTRGAVHRILVDRPRALYGSWYEFFPRSTGGRAEDGTPRHGTFATAAADLERIARMGFDVVYLPPVHPIGRINRKGPGNTVPAGPGDHGSPWAVGAAEGGHDAIHPDLGTLADFDAFVERARGLGLEVALDLALQCAPDHPWVAEHPAWFTRRPDGTVAYAQNPPKKYEDIYPIDFDTDRDGVFAEVLRVVLHWAAHGVRIFRVDNPHTKPPDFWHRLIEEVKRQEPDILFLAEAFTRPARLYGLARLGFTQSYTYFTWRTSGRELAEFGAGLVEHADEARPNLFVNTPDILHASLQHGGPAMFALRAALAATLSPTWGVYAGYELYESAAVREGSEEYLDSEKYELRPRDFAAALARGRSLEPWITRLNAIRRAHAALRQLRDLHFHETDNDALLAYSKRDELTGDTVLIVVNLDPHRTQEGTVRWDLSLLGLVPGTRFDVLDEVGGEIFTWSGQDYVKLDPTRAVAHIAAVIAHD
jgi:starch synthase (maltosyl-transferring)